MSYVVIVVLIVIFVGMVAALRYTSPPATSAASPTVASTVSKPSGLRLLPSVFYAIAGLGFVAFIVLAVQAESGYLFGYGIGSTIACLASGRVIDLLQNIDDELYRKRMSE